MSDHANTPVPPRKGSVEPNPEWLTVRQAAALLGGVSVKLVYRLRDAGELSSRKVGRAVRIGRASVEAYIDRHERPASGEGPPAATARPRTAARPAAGFVFLPPKPRAGPGR